jgi:UDP-N-acetyl-alpha-D-muramoyl-L-alanyl-L-glutamate epimerase
LTKEYMGCGAFIIKQSPQSEKLTQAANIKEVVKIERSINPKLLELNSQGFLNGHTPYSSVLAFYGVFGAYLFGYKHLAFSNERSSNEGNTEYLGRVVNHQYSKTFEFENKFRRYNQTYLSDINYFSFVRPIHEIQIAKVFSEIGGKYFQIFRSCNIGLKEGIWCGKCPKCLSTFVLLYPFLGSAKLVGIFGKDLFKDGSLKEMLLDLTEVGRVKPFECVGTKEELKLCLYLAVKLDGNSQKPLLKIAAEEILTGEKNLEQRSRAILSDWGDENNLPENFQKVLRKYL